MESTGSVLVIIPAYNAQNTLKELSDRLYASVPDIRIIIVDDGSADRTSEIGYSTGAVVLRHDKNRGKGAALQTGFDRAKNIPGIDYVVTMDADLQHRPEDITNFLQANKKVNADIYVGWRKRIGTGMPAHRILSNVITSFLVGIRTGTMIKDSQCGFRMISMEVLKNIQLESEGYEAETEFLIKAAIHNYKIEFVPVQTVYGNEISHMTHYDTTLKFVKVLLRGYE